MLKQVFKFALQQIRGDQKVVMEPGDIIGTGEPIESEEYQHIKTVQQPPYMWHVFEKRRKVKFTALLSNPFNGLDEQGRIKGLQ